MFKGSRQKPFIRIYGWINEQGQPQTSTDPYKFLQVIRDAPILYGHDVLATDLVALAANLGADYLDLAEKTIDTLVGERTINPPYPKLRPGAKLNHAALRAKGLTPGDLQISYELKVVAERYGIEASTLSTGKNAPLDHGEISRHLLVFRDIYREMGRRAASKGLINVIKREVLIARAQNHMYLKGLGADRPEVERQVAQAHSQRQEAYAFLNKAAGVPLPDSEYAWRERVDIPLSTFSSHGRKVRARYERLFGQRCPDIRAGWRWRTKYVGSAPLLTDEGRNAFEKALRTAGVKDEDVPFTPGGSLALSQHALGEGAWLRSKESVPGLIAKYPDNPEIVALCRAAIQVTTASGKAEEVLDAICPDGRIHPRIGDLQAAGRWAHVEPSVSNFGKRGKSLEQRRMVKAKKGHVLIAIDLDQADPRAIAGWSKDPEYRKIVKPGMDVYQEIAFRVFGSRSDEARKNAKGSVNGWNYGQGPKGAAAFTGLPEATMKVFDRGMQASFSVACGWRKRVRDYAIRTGTVPSKWNRPLRVIPGQEYTQAPAQVGQSTTRDLICDGLLRMDREVLEMVVLVIHDEIVLEVPVERVEEIGQRAVVAITTVFEGVEITCGISPASESWIGCYEKAA